MQLKLNEYSDGIKRLHEEKLREYVEKPGDFHDEAVLAAIWELERRRPLLGDEKALEESINKRVEIKIPEPAIVTATNITFEEKKLPSLYSMTSIRIFSVLFSVLAGGILMAINLNRTTQKTESYKVLGFSLLYTVVSISIFSLLGTQSPIMSVILNLLGAFLIDELFWKRVLGREFKFQKQQIWTALLIALIIISPLVWYAIKTGAALPV